MSDTLIVPVVSVVDAKTSILFEFLRKIRILEPCLKEKTLKLLNFGEHSEIPSFLASMDCALVFQCLL